MILLLHSTAIFLGLISVAAAINCKGCLPLDSYTFDKVISKFKASVIKFDVAYPYGPKHDEFAKVSEAAFTIPELLIGEVGVKDYGDQENSDLAERYKVSKEDFPVIKLFVEGKKDPFTYSPGTSEDFTADNIKKFIRSTSGIYIGLPGCLERFDRLVAEFLAESDEKAQRKLLRDAENLWDKAQGRSEQRAAETYVKLMRKVIDKGKEFVDGEMKRVEGLIKGKVSKEKKEELQNRINILQSFRKDEL
ncbi:endoplasmic reticulum resident protein 29 [Ischnura elegans]|uniref:endoplasmic reticulum resident protein 29 n=1 Tax=Ischnura elegans TaxID=197161 RepID=UPI001ED8B8F2|nr:endoplasmic reticulum resident protein 29 [Ischnura elegans]